MFINETIVLAPTVKSKSNLKSNLGKKCCGLLWLYSGLTDVGKARN